MKCFHWLIVFFIFLSLPSFAQFRQKIKRNSYDKATKRIERQLINRERKKFQSDNYEQDIQDYTELLKIDSINPRFNLGMAITLYTNFREPKSVFYFERGLRHSKDTIGDAYFFLANAYHLAGNYDLAEKNYKIYDALLLHHGSELPKKEDALLKENIKHRIEMCENGKASAASNEKSVLVKEGKKIVITDAGKNINSGFDDYGTFFTENDSVMYFTSRREGTTGNRLDYDDKYYEDIYVSQFKDGSWSAATGIGSPINTKKHDAVLGISRNGKRIYFYTSKKQGTFFYSDFKNGKWTKPQPVFSKESNINSQGWQPSFIGFTITVAGDELFVVSDREGGMGGRDIYVSHLQKDSTWGQLENLGPPINTKYDEDGPYITPDGNTMYFSSNGHNSMGGFDVFRSERKDGKWEEPKNLGSPINTPGDDVFFMFLHNSERAYYSSSGYAKDSTRDLDIYTVDFCDDIKENTIKGLAKGISTGTITVTSKDSGKVVGKAIIQDEKYTLALGLGKQYVFKVEIPGIEPVYANVFVPDQCLKYDIYQELTFTKPGEPLSVKNSFFDIAKSTLNAGQKSYHDFLQVADKTKLSNYTEELIPTTPPTYTDTLKATVSTKKDTIRHTTQTTITFDNVLFDFNKYNIKKEYKPDLNKIIDYLVNASPKDKIEIAGHTDSIGSVSYNLILSKRRAEVVAVYFVQNGVVRKRMKVVGYGKSKPIAPNSNPDGSDNPAGRAKNRRTEIIILNTDVTAVIDDYFDGKKIYRTKEIKDLTEPSNNQAPAQNIPSANK